MMILARAETIADGIRFVDTGPPSSGFHDRMVWHAIAAPGNTDPASKPNLIAAPFELSQWEKLYTLDLRLSHRPGQFADVAKLLMDSNVTIMMAEASASSSRYAAWRALAVVPRDSDPQARSDLAEKLISMADAANRSARALQLTLSAHLSSQTCTQNSPRDATDITGPAQVVWLRRLALYSALRRQDFGPISFTYDRDRRLLRVQSASTEPFEKLRASRGAGRAIPLQYDTQTSCIKFVLADSGDEDGLATDSPSPESTSVPRSFDVFIAYRSRDRAVVERIAKQLTSQDLIPWFDEWDLRPGTSFQSEIEAVIDHIQSAAVFVGSDGIGPWQEVEVRSLIEQAVKRKIPVIPVLLPGASVSLLPPFLRSYASVEFTSLEDSHAMGKLVFGITGRNPRRE